MTEVESKAYVADGYVAPLLRLTHGPRFALQYSVTGYPSNLVSVGLGVPRRYGAPLHPHCPRPGWPRATS
jgi:hypothetical protein